MPILAVQLSLTDDNNMLIARINHYIRTHILDFISKQFGLPRAAAKTFFYSPQEFSVNFLFKNTVNDHRIGSCVWILFLQCSVISCFFG